MALGLWNGDNRSDLSDQIASLQSELRSLQREAAKRGAHAYEGARDGASELAEMLGDTIGTVRSLMGRRAHVAGGMVRAHPGAAATAAIVGLAVAGLAASLFMGRGEPTKPALARPKAKSAQASAPKRRSAPRKSTAKRPAKSTPKSESSEKPAA